MYHSIVQLRLRDGAWLLQDHTAAKWEDVNLGSDSQPSALSTLQMVTPAGFSASVLESLGHWLLLTMAV